MVWFCSGSLSKRWVPKAKPWVLAVFAQRVDALGSDTGQIGLAQ
jgi:hypothetical protein